MLSAIPGHYPVHQLGDALEIAPIFLTEEKASLVENGPPATWIRLGLPDEREDLECRTTTAMAATTTLPKSTIDINSSPCVHGIQTN